MCVCGGGGGASHMAQWKNPPAKAGDARNSGTIPGSGRFPGVGNSNPLQYSYLGNSMDRRAWQVQSMGLQRVRHNWVTEHTHTCICLCVCTYIHVHTCFNRGALGEILVLPPTPYKEPVVVRIISLLSSKDAQIPNPYPCDCFQMWQN